MCSDTGNVEKVYFLNKWVYQRYYNLGAWVASDKATLAHAGDARDVGSILGLEGPWRGFVTHFPIALV